MTHVAIIGGGVVGATIAYELSKNPELTLTLIEENRAVQGATKAALGVLVGISSQKKTGRAWELRKNSILRYPHLINELEHLTQKPINHNNQGLVHLCYCSDSLIKWQKLQEIRQSQGWTLEIWTPNDLAQKCPYIRVSQELVAAIYSPSDWQINPLELTQALLQASSIQGVNLQFGHKVSQLLTTNITANLKHCQAIVLDNQKIPIDFLVIAAGLGSVPLTINLQQHLKMQPVLGQAMHLELKAPLQESKFQPVITADDIHIVPLQNGKYWLGATVEYPDATEQYISPDVQLLPEILARATYFFPALSESKIISTWSGNRPRPVGLLAPIIEKLSGYSNIILATGHYRNGVLLAPATAQKVQELIQKQH